MLDVIRNTEVYYDQVFQRKKIAAFFEGKPIIKWHSVKGQFSIRINIQWRICFTWRRGQCLGCGNC